jgi:hypothetical protein
MPTMGRRPQKSGAAKAADRLSGLLPGMGGQKRGGSGGRGKKGTAGLALLAGAAGLLVKNREKLTSMIRHKDSSGDEVKPAEPQAFPSTSGPVQPQAFPSTSGPVQPSLPANPLAPPDQPAA